MQFKGQAVPLGADDYARAASIVRCDLAAIRAVVDVEARGKGFGADGRPIILYEPHIFHRQLGPGEKRNRAIRQKLAASKWGAIPYPRTQAARYRQLEAAIAIDRNAALKSASWGLGQIMGFNHRAAGFDTVGAFVEAMMRSEGDQLAAMARFIVSNRLDRAIRERNWAAFAKGYNGAGYRKNAYDKKLAAAYARHARKSAAPPKARPKPKPEPRADIESLQRDLVALGFNPGPVDGLIGPKTRAAVSAFRVSVNLAASPRIDTSLIADVATARRSMMRPELPDAGVFARFLRWLFFRSSAKKGLYMSSTKPWFLSKGVIGGAVTLVASLAGLAGFEFGPDLGQQLTEQIILTITAAGGVLSLVGRLLATRRIGMR